MISKKQNCMNFFPTFLQNQLFFLSNTGSFLRSFGIKSAHNSCLNSDHNLMMRGCKTSLKFKGTEVKKVGNHMVYRNHELLPENSFLFYHAV